MISVIQKPQTFTPSDNPIIFQIESTSADIVYFKVEILDADTDAVINKMDISVTPDYTNGSYVNLSRILRNAVKWEVNNAINLLSLPVSRPILKYKVQFTERGLFGSEMVDLSPAHLVPDTFYTWNADLGRHRFNKFIYGNYVVTAGLPAKFLTYKPNGVRVNEYSSEQLYFLHESEDILNVQVKTYSSTGTLLGTFTEGISGIGSAKQFRIQASPKALAETLLIDFSNVDRYTVQLVDENGTGRTELRTFYYYKISCAVDPINLFWVNSLGGIDTFQFVNQTETNQITRSSIKKNPYRLVEGFYTDRAGDILNPTEELISVSQSGSYTAQSQFITDAQSIWLNELFVSQQVFVELADNSLVPVIVQNSSYQIQKQKLNKGGYTTTSVTYTHNGELIPSDAIAYQSGFDAGISLDFIDEQLNSN